MQMRILAMELRAFADEMKLFATTANALSEAGLETI
jgi:hypothetical protein